MINMKSISRAAFRYGGERVQSGAEFSVKSKRDAKILTATGRAEVAPPPTPPAIEQPKPRRTYKRRDMAAEAAEPQTSAVEAAVEAVAEAAAAAAAPVDPDLAE